MIVTCIKYKHNLDWYINMITQAHDMYNFFTFLHSKINVTYNLTVLLQVTTWLVGVGDGVTAVTILRSRGGVVAVRATWRVPVAYAQWSDPTQFKVSLVMDMLTSVQSLAL